MSEHGSDPPGGEAPSIDALRSELDASRQRIAELEAENAALVASGPGDAEKPPSARGTHRVWVAILLVLGMVLTPIGILALFLKSEIKDTDRYVQNVAPLSSDPAIQAYVADDITKELFARVDIRKYVKKALPDEARVLAAPLTTALQNFVREATVRILQTDQFQRLWIDANRIAHDQLVNVLTGEKTAAISATSNGAVQIDLSSVAQLVGDRLQSTGIDLFSAVPIAQVGGKITLFQSGDLYKVRGAVGILDKLAFFLPFVVFGMFGAAIYVSRDRRRGFVLAALAFTLGALMLALFLFMARGLYLDAATGSNLPYDAAAAVYDTLVRFLHTAVRAVLTFSIVVLIVVLFSGPSRFAIWFRSRVKWSANWLGAESDRAGWHWLKPNAFVVRHKTALRIACAVLAFVIVFWAIHPSPASIVGIGIVTLVALAIIEFFGREPFPSTGPVVSPHTPRASAT